MNALKGFFVVSAIVGSTALAKAPVAPAKPAKATVASDAAAAETAAKKADLKVTTPVKGMTTAQRAKAAGF